ncbi:PD-(D/E)XK nuclease family protein [Caldivirga sp.]|uniref:PD-(D/E)XK nuclease family protein n=1 Tax=Caldivirga sp. TaxID=2080243 RepID=UPI003D144E74
MGVISQVPELTLIEGKPILKWGGASYLIPRLKHGVLFLMVNQLAVQLKFCEYRIHLDFTKGRVIGNEAIDGLYEHARQFGDIAGEFSLEPGWDPVVVNRGEEGVSFFNMRMRNWIGKADFTKPYIEERSVVALIKGVPILGLPDLIINRDGKPWLVIELKTTNRVNRLGFLEPREAYQVEAYYHFLRMMGLGVEGALVVKIIRGIGVRVVDYVEALIKAFTSGVNHSRLSNGVMMHVVKVRETAEFMKETEWAVDYWLGLRNATPSPSPGKCRVCDHRSHCPYSLS